MLDAVKTTPYRRNYFYLLIEKLINDFVLYEYWHVNKIKNKLIIVDTPFLIVKRLKSRLGRTGQVKWVMIFRDQCTLLAYSVYYIGVLYDSEYDTMTLGATNFSAFASYVIAVIASHSRPFIAVKWRRALVGVKTISNGCLTCVLLSLRKRCHRWKTRYNYVWRRSVRRFFGPYTSAFFAVIVLRNVNFSHKKKYNDCCAPNGVKIVLNTCLLFWRTSRCIKNVFIYCPKNLEYYSKKNHNFFHSISVVSCPVSISISHKRCACGWYQRLLWFSSF